MKNMSDKHGAIISFCCLSARRHFGSWSGALRAAGIRQASRKAYRSRLPVLRTLRDALEKASRKHLSQTLRVEAAHYFGSLRNAQLALKKDQKLLRGWSREKIIAALSRMHRSNESLAYGRARRDVAALVSAAEAYFGSWGKALYVAGIDPNLYFVHHKWRKLAKV
jgi:hypothetical protein